MHFEDTFYSLSQTKTTACGHELVDSTIQEVLLDEEEEEEMKPRESWD